MKFEMDIGFFFKLFIDMDFQYVFDLEMIKKMFNFGGKLILILNFIVFCDYLNSGYAVQQIKVKFIVLYIQILNFSDLNCFIMR